MRDSLHSYMRVGIVHFMAFPGAKSGMGPIADWVRRVVEDDFFGAIEVTRIKDPMEKGKVAALVQSGGMALGFGAHPVILGGGLDLNHADANERRRAVDAIRACIDEAAVLGADSVTVLSGRDVPAEVRPTAMELLVDSLVQLSVYAGGKGLKLQLEAFDRDIDKRCLIGPSKDARRVAEAVRGKCGNFGLMVDLSHLPQIGEEPEDCLREVAPYLTHVHIGNCIIKDRTHPLYGDNHPRFGMPGGEVGVPELARFLRALLSCGYLGGGGKGPLPVVAFEVQPAPGESPDAVIAGSKRALTQAWAMV